MEIKEIDRKDATSVKKARRFDDRDWKKVAEYVIDTWNKRKEKRRDLEREWCDIDRQVKMKPEIEYKKLPDGRVDWRKNWMAETELPLQAQALEVLTSDARRMMFAENDRWFRAHSEVTDAYLRKIEGEGGIRVLGDENYIPSTVNQDNADKLVEGFLNHIFRQYDHVSRFDKINAEAFKYGTGVGRCRIETKNCWIHEARGVRTEKQKIPVIVPATIKKLYLEDEPPSFHSATVLGPAHIMEDEIKFENIALAAQKGSNDPDDEDGGWMPKQLAKLLPGKGGYVTVLEMEGDVIVPRKSVKSVVIPNALVTVAIGGPETGGASTSAVIRFRFRKRPFSSYLLFPYMHEGADEHYASGPLHKGRTVQMTATDATNRFLDAAMLKNSPPIGYDRNDPEFASSGGPNIHPNAKWASMDPVKVYSEVGGDPSALAQAALQMVNLYAELTGVLPARIGGKTTSHTTAQAKQIELQRGSVRTVDYVNSVGHGPLTNWLNIAYQLGRECFPKGKFSLWIPAYTGYVEIDKSMLPENASFEWFGAGGPQELMQKAQKKLQSAELALKLDQLGIQVGRPPKIDLDKLIMETLREGGWDDPGAITVQQPQSPAGNGAPAPGISGAGQGNPGATIAALQNLGGGGPQ